MTRCDRSYARISCVPLSILLPIPAQHRSRRFVQLYAGLALYGLSVALMVRSDLGLDPWDVFHQGLATRMGLSIGISTILVSAVVLLLWIPLRQRPGLGTISNAILIGVAMDATLLLLSTPNSLVVRAAFLAAGIFLNGVATGFYIGAGLGPGPRDGLMTGISAKGHSIRLVRTSIEVSVLALGWVLGGTVGLGTVAYALTIGPLAHVFIPRLAIDKVDTATPPSAHASLP